MDFYKKLNKQNLISIGIILTFIIFCFVISSHHTIPINPVPLSNPSIEALFYVRSSSGSSNLEDCTCIGDGLLYSDKEIYNDEVIVSENIATSPDYTNYLPLDITIAWDTITCIDGKFIVIGSLVPKTEPVEIRDFQQYDNYGSVYAQIRNKVKPKTIYYFSSSGKDSNNGLSPNTPKKDPTSVIKNGNCQILLKSGETFTITWGLNPGSNVIVSTYGGSERAAISLVHNTTETFKLVDNSNSIYSVPLRKNDRGASWIRINGIQYWKRVMTNNLTLDYEYYVDETNKVIYVKSPVNLTGQTLEYGSNWNGFNINTVQNIIVENIELAGCGSHGIHITGSSNILITNCYIHDIGGSAQNVKTKFGNGVEIWATGCNNIAIYKNIITDCFDAALTAQINSEQTSNTSNLYFTNNLIERCNYGFECFHSSKQYTMKNVVVDNNIFYDIKDITNGYRLTQSSTDYTAFLCLWDYKNSNSSIIINHNFGYGTQTNAISYSWKSEVMPPITYTDNTFITDKESAIKYSKHYTGKDDQYLTVKNTTNENSKYNKLAKQLMSKYSLSKLIY